MPSRHARAGDPLPWGKPYQHWSDDELEAGMWVCDEFRWRNLQRGIEREMSGREGSVHA